VSGFLFSGKLFAILSLISSQFKSNWFYLLLLKEALSRL
jgi:hypothetical protein